MAWPHNLHVGHVYMSMWFPLQSEGEGTAIKALFRNYLRNVENGLSLQLNLSSNFSCRQWVDRQEKCCHLTYILHFTHFPYHCVSDSQPLMCFRITWRPNEEQRYRHIKY